VSRSPRLMAALVSPLVLAYGVSSEVRASTLTVDDAYSWAYLRLHQQEHPDGSSKDSLDIGTTSASLSDSHGGASATTTVSSQPAPMITGSVSATVYNSQAIVYSLMLYHFGLDGPADMYVPVTITANSWLSPAAGLGDMNHAVLSTYGPGVNELLAEICVAGTPSNCGPLGNLDFFSIETTLIVQSMKQYTVFLSLYLSATGGGSASGWIDPIITIHPDYVGQFSLVLSEGVGNSVTPVPVPGALLLFATGLGGMALVGWRRKRRMSGVMAQ
jgi:hypothetical protein